MNGTKLLIDTAVFSAKGGAREIAVSELCNKNFIMALEYVAKNSEFPDTRMSVIRYLYIMEADAALKRIAKSKRFRDAARFAKKLLERREFDDNLDVAYIEDDDTDKG